MAMSHFLRPQVCCFIRQRGSRCADGIKVVNQPILKWGISLDYPGGPNVITWVLNSGKRRLNEKQKDGSLNRTWPNVVGFESGEWT